MTESELSEKLAHLVCEALNGDLSANVVMSQVRDTENKLAAFMLSADSLEFVDDVPGGVN